MPIWLSSRSDVSRKGRRMWTRVNGANVVQWCLRLTFFLNLVWGKHSGSAVQGLALFHSSRNLTGSLDSHLGGVECGRLRCCSHIIVSQTRGCWSNLRLAFPAFASWSQGKCSKSTFQGWSLYRVIGIINSRWVGFSLCSCSRRSGTRGFGWFSWSWRDQRRVGAQCLVSIGKSWSSKEIWSHTQERGAASWAAWDWQDHCGTLAGQPPEGEILPRARDDAAGSDVESRCVHGLEFWSTLLMCSTQTYTQTKWYYSCVVFACSVHGMECTGHVRTCSAHELQMTRDCNV